VVSGAALLRRCRAALKNQQSELEMPGIYVALEMFGKYIALFLFDKRLNFDHHLLKNCVSCAENI
jgi:hypothetical protein